MPLLGHRSWVLLQLGPLGRCSPRATVRLILRRASLNPACVAARASPSRARPGTRRTVCSFARARAWHRAPGEPQSSGGASPACGLLNSWGCSSQAFLSPAVNPPLLPKIPAPAWQRHGYRVPCITELAPCLHNRTRHPSPEGRAWSSFTAGRSVRLSRRSFLESKHPTGMCWFHQSCLDPMERFHFDKAPTL